MVDQRFISKAAFFASFFALGVIALGAFTRLIDAGLGCPDWPGCYGHLTVPAAEQAKKLVMEYPNTPLVAYKAWAEMAHRYFVGALSIFILTIVLAIFSKKANRSFSNFVLAFSLIILLVYQIILGRWTVTLKLLPIIVTQHLLGGFLILSILWVIYLNNKLEIDFIKNNSVPRKILPWAIVGLIFLFLQILLGAWTSTNYASLSCPDFPMCVNDQALSMKFKKAFDIFSPIGINYEGGVLSQSIRQTIQMTHRIGALILFVYMFVFSSISIQKLKNYPEILKLFYLILGLLTLQICIGITNVIFKLPLVSAIFHNLVAVILLLSVITLIFKLSIGVKKVKQDESFSS